MLRKGRFFLVFIVCYPILSASAVVCESNQYNDGEFCYTCPANATCDGTDFVCNDGWYENDTMCEKCSIENSTCSGAGDYSCLSGFYDDGKGCNACPENATCAGGHEYFYCKAGYYKHRDSICVSCVGQVCQDGELIRCGDGYYLHSSGYCYRCNQGYYCPPGEAVVGITCDNGYYKGEGGVCYVCPVGYYCIRAESTSDNLYDYCAPGYYRTGGSCSKCEDDVVCPGGKIEEMVCPDGLYKHDDGRCLSYAQNDCGIAPSCNPGCYNSNGVCIKCVDNSTCTSADDFICNAGYYNNGTACEVCPDNSNCPAGSTEIHCFDGYYLNQNSCVTCGNGGYYCNNNIRYVCPSVVEDILDTPFKNHKFLKYNNIGSRNTPLSSSVTECLVQSVYFSAPEGEYLITFAAYNGSKYQIKNSQAKYWYSANSGYYLDVVRILNGMVYYTYSKQCTNGAENSYYTGAGSPEGNDCPWVCNDGFYRDGNSCLLCPDGMECVGGGIICPAGMYADKNKCITCPDGYTDSQDTGAQSINACQIKCAGGSYVSVVNSTSCNNVGAGYWIGENYTNYGATGVRNACVGGMTTVGYGPGADEAADCGRILHIGDKKVYLRSAKQTSPSLVIKYLDTFLYGDLTTENKGSIKLNINNKIYSLYDSITQ